MRKLNTMLTSFVDREGYAYLLQQITYDGIPANDARYEAEGRVA